MSDLIIAYDISGAYSSGIRVNPEENLKSMGVDVLKWESVDVMKIVFLRVNQTPSPLPEYIHICCPSFKFSDEV